MNQTKANALIFIASPFQAYSVLNLHYSGVLDSFDYMDCIIEDFEGADQILDSFTKAGIFNDLYRYHNMDMQQRYSFLKALALVLFRRQRVRAHLSNVFNESFLEKNYKFLVMSSARDISFFVKTTCCPEAKTILFDDGSGSYTGAVVNRLLFLDNCPGQMTHVSFREYVKWSVKAVVNRITHQSLQFNVCKVLLYAPDKNLTSIYGDLPIEKIKSPSSAENSKIAQILSQDTFIQSEYRNASLIFFAVPDSGIYNKGLLKLECDLFNIAYKNCLGRVIYRPHPRTRAISTEIPPEVIDDSNSNWELLCSCGAVSEDSYLISYGSSSMLMPKKITNIEPHLVYLYHFLPDSFSQKRYLEKEYLFAKSIYADNDRVTAPASLTELADIISRGQQVL